MYATYLRELRKNIGYHATWLPSEQIAVGSVGVFDKEGRFHEETNLARLGITMKMVLGDSKALIKYRSAAGVSVDFKIAGEAPAKDSILSIDEAGFTISLNHNNAIVFEAVGCKHERIEDVDDVGNQIIQRVDAKAWKEHYLVITGVIRADSATVLVSNGNQGKFEASITGAATAGTVSVGDAKLGISVKHSSSLGIEIPAEVNLTPLYSAYRVRKGWWRQAQWEPAKGMFEGPLEEASVDDLLAAVAKASAISE